MSTDEEKRKALRDLFNEDIPKYLTRNLEQDFIEELIEAYLIDWKRGEKTGEYLD